MLVLGGKGGLKPISTFVEIKMVIFLEGVPNCTAKCPFQNDLNYFKPFQNRFLKF